MLRKKIILTVLLTPFGLLAGTDWAPVTSADWEAGKAEKWKDANAIILFEKVIVDERQATEGIYTTTLYRRIKIKNPRGYNQADVSLPYIHKKQKVKSMKGRTLWPDGRIFNLDKGQIFATDILSMKKLAIKKKAFSLPGVQDGCIIEYMLTYESPSRVSHLNVQKEIPLLQYELLWYYYNIEIPYGLVVSKDERKKLESYLTTPYVRCYNLPIYEFLQPGSEGNPEADCMRFKTSDLPAFEGEPLATQEVLNRGAVRLYYRKRTGDYWSESADNLREDLKKFAKSHSRFDVQYQLLADGVDSSSYVQRVYDWIGRQIRNTDYKDDNEDDKAKKIETLDDVLANRCGSSYDINRLFYFFIKQHGLKPELAFVADRRERIVDKEVQDWQFDDSMLLVPLRPNVYETYMPGTRYLQAGRIPYYYEGTTAFVVDTVSFAWSIIPFSSAAENAVKRILELDLDDTGVMTGRFFEQSEGQVAWFRRMAIGGEDSTAVVEALGESLRDVMPLAEVDSIRWQSADSLNTKMTLSCKVAFPPAGRCTGNRYFLQASDFVGRDENPLVAPSRTAHILMNYASDIIENIRMAPGARWQVHSLPEPTRYPHVAGKIEGAYSEVGGFVSMQRHITISKPFWKKEEYAQVRRFLQQRALLNNELIVLGKKPL